MLVRVRELPIVSAKRKDEAKRLPRRPRMFQKVFSHILPLYRSGLTDGPLLSLIYTQIYPIFGGNIPIFGIPRVSELRRWRV